MPLCKQLLQVLQGIFLSLCLKQRDADSKKTQQLGIYRITAILEALGAVLCPAPNPPCSTVVGLLRLCLKVWRGSIECPPRKNLRGQQSGPPQKCSTRESFEGSKSLSEEFPQSLKVFFLTRVPQEHLKRVSSQFKAVAQKRLRRVPTSVPRGPTRVSRKSVPQECPARVSWFSSSAGVLYYNYRLSF